jgi:hypothetical protein
LKSGAPGIAGQVAPALGIVTMLAGNLYGGALLTLGGEMAAGKITSLMANMKLARLVKELPGGEKILNDILAKNNGKLSERASNGMLNAILTEVAKTAQTAARTPGVATGLQRQGQPSPGQ